MVESPERNCGKLGLRLSDDPKKYYSYSILIPEAPADINWWHNQVVLGRQLLAEPYKYPNKPF